MMIINIIPDTIKAWAKLVEMKLSHGDNIKAVIHFFNELKWKLTEKLTEMFKIKAPMEISNRRIHTNFQRDINGGH